MSPRSKTCSVVAKSCTVASAHILTFYWHQQHFTVGAPELAGRAAAGRPGAGGHGRRSGVSISYRVAGLISGFSPSLRRRSACRGAASLRVRKLNRTFAAAHCGIKQRRTRGFFQEDATSVITLFCFIKTASELMDSCFPSSCITHLSLGLWMDLWKITVLTLLKRPRIFSFSF